MLHDVATRREEPQSVFISELSGRLCCVNGTIGLTGASCCHASVEKDIIETRLFDTALIMTSASLPVGSVTVAFCVCRCSKCLVHYLSSTVGCSGQLIANACVCLSQCVCVCGIIHLYCIVGRLFKIELQQTICNDFHALELAERPVRQRTQVHFLPLNMPNGNQLPNLCQLHCQLL